MTDAKEGETCPIRGCDHTVGNNHWVANPEGYHTYHTNKRNIARVWEWRSEMDVTPTTEPLPAYETNE